MTNAKIFRPRSVWFSGAVCAIIISSLVFQTLLTGDAKSIVFALTIGFTAFVASYLLFIHPKITLFDEGIKITNPFSTIVVGWDKVQSIEARYTMSVQVGGRQIYAWAAPAPGRYHSRNIHPSEVKGLEVGFNGEMRPGESPRSDSGQASHLAKLRLKSFIENGTTGCEGTVSINRTGITLLMSSIILSIALGALGF